MASSIRRLFRSITTAVPQPHAPHTNAKKTSLNPGMLRPVRDKRIPLVHPRVVYVVRNVDARAMSTALRAREGGDKRLRGLNKDFQSMNTGK